MLTQVAAPLFSVTFLMTALPTLAQSPDLTAVDGLKVGHIHELHLPGLRSADKKPLLHQQAYYTLNYLAK